MLAADPEVDADPNAVGYDSDATTSEAAWRESDALDTAVSTSEAVNPQDNVQPVLPEADAVDDNAFLEGWD